MAEQFVTSANGDTTLGYALCGSNTWNKGTSNGACQGAYQGTTAAKSRVGVLVFSGAGNALRGKAIQQIELSVTSASAGSSSSLKVLTLRKSRVQSMPTTQNGSDVVGDTLGTLTGKFYGNTVSFTLNASSKPYRKRAWVEGEGTRWLRKLEYQKPRVRSKVEYVFHVIKGIFVFHKTRYKGLAKLKTHLDVLCASANFFMLATARRGKPKESRILKRLCSSTLNSRGHFAFYREVPPKWGGFSGNPPTLTSFSLALSLDLPP